MGGSSGAACAFTMAWFHPELYRKVLSYSGTYVNQQSPLNPESPRGAGDTHATLIPSTPAKPIRIWMHVSERDNRYTDQEDTWHNVAGERANGRRAQSQGLQVSVRLFPGLTARRSGRRRADPARSPRVAVEGLLGRGQAVNRQAAAPWASKRLLHVCSMLALVSAMMSFVGELVSRTYQPR